LLKKGNEGLFKDHPFLHEVLVWDKGSQKLMNFDKLMHRVWFAKYDAVINLQRFLLTGLMTAFSRAEVKIGFDKNPMSFLFTKKIPHTVDRHVHETERNVSLIASLTDSLPEKPRLYPSAGDREKISSFITGVFYTISPASLWYTKQFPEEKWIGLIRMIPPGRRVFLLGSKDDGELCARISSASGNAEAINLAGKLSLLESTALMHHARMNFTNDSAAMHLASAINAPVTVVYCSTVPGFGFGPLSDDSTVIQTALTLPCRPCGLHGNRKCPEEHFQCALSIPADDLAQRL